MVTQCPKCHTSFRVSQAQLCVANGSVRCGSCLTIFNATTNEFNQRDNPISDQKTENEQFQLTDEETTNIEKIDNLDSANQPNCEDDNKNILDNTIEQNAFNSIFEDDLESNELAEVDESVFDNISLDVDFQLDDFQSGDDTTQTIATDDYTFGTAATGTTTSPFGDALNTSADDNSNDNEHEDYKDPDDFEYIADQEVHLDEGNNEPSLTDTNYSHDFLDLDLSDQETPTPYKELNENTDDEAQNEEQWALNLLAEDDNDETQNSTSSDINEPEQVLFTEFENENRLDPELLDILKQRDQSAPIPPIPEQEITFGNETIIAGDRIGHDPVRHGHTQALNPDKDELVVNIEPEVIAIAAKKNPDRWYNRGWSTAILIAALTLAGQYLYFNFDHIALNSKSRPLLVQACKLIACTVPTPNDISQIRSTRLMIRSHPEASNALVVDATITNLAGFSQNFPDVELLFTDLNGKTIAQRRFSPPEYIHGELSGSNTMPRNQPIHISFEIVDPGQNAVNYQLNFRSNSG